MSRNIGGEKPAVSVVMITLNEEKSVAKVVNDIRGVVPGAEIVIVDSSSDSTFEIAQSLGCTAVKQFPPQGYGKAMHAGFLSATGDVVITMDCDDTYPCQAINEFLDKIAEGYDLVSGSRLGRKPDAMPLANFIANWVFAKTANLLCGVATTDVHTGMRAYKRSMLEQIPYDPNGPALPVELQVCPASLGYKCNEFFIDYHPRIGESKLQPIQSTIWTFKRLWKWRRFFNARRSPKIEQLQTAKR